MDHYLFLSSILIIIGTLFVYYITRDFVISCLVSFIKSMYFLWNAVYAFVIPNIADDRGYFETGKRLFYEGENALYAIFAQSIGLDVVFGHSHYLYHLFVLLFIQVFGLDYYSPVTGNIIFTFISALMLYDILKLNKIDEFKSRIFVIFFLLHPDTIAWSSFLTIKDPFVQLLTISTFWSFNRLIILRKIRYILPLILTAIFIDGTRAYLNILFFLALSLFIFTQICISNYKFKKNIILFSIIVGSVAIPYLVFVKWQHGLHYFNISAYGMVRFILTPLPTQISSEYAYLLIPSITHWLLMPFFGVGLCNAIYRRDNMSVMFVSYFIMIYLFYSFVEALQGPRHRYQILFIIAYFQFDGILLVKKWFASCYKEKKKVGILKI